MPAENDNFATPRPGFGWAFALSIFLGAWLVFQIQPVMSKLILPWFGGSPNVWTVCLLFFQTLLFGGYTFAFSLARWSGPRRQVLIYVSLLIVAGILAPVRPTEAFRPNPTDDPAFSILKLLAFHIGPPYLLLCATGPLLQDWFRRSFPHQSPYRLYALSNAGSLLGLLTYPFLVEVLIPASMQATLWRLLFMGFALSVVLCGKAVWGTQSEAVPGTPSAPIPPLPRKTDRVFWFLLAMLPTLLLPAVTNRLTQDIGGVPFLWIIPLTIYLISLIWCFSSDRAYSRMVWGTLFFLALFVIAPMMMAWRHKVFSSLPLMVLSLGALYSTVCMVCHGELAKLKPAPERLTEFYLVMSAGGAAGGIFSGLLAPMIFPIYLEYHLGLFGSYALFLAACYRDPTSRLHGFRAHRVAWYGLALATISLMSLLTNDVRKSLTNGYLLKRNFYGVLRVELVGDKGPLGARVELVHGDIRHGSQYLREENQGLKTTYYDERSGVGLALLNHHADRSRRIGLIGLGTGTLAAYAKPGDEFDFFEINPDVVDLAEEVFMFLKNAPSKNEIILGDARLNLERMPSRQYDVLVVDAFSGDAIPAHLLTEEAMEVFLKHLKPDGILAVHISNKFFELEPVVNSHARKFNLSTLHVHRVAEEARSITASVWMLVSPDPSVLAISEYRQPPGTRDSRRIPWTDDFNSPFSVLKIVW